MKSAAIKKKIPRGAAPLTAERRRRFVPAANSPHFKPFQITSHERAADAHLSGFTVCGTF